MYLGVEIGGTKLQLGVGLGDGVLRGLWRETVDVKAGPEGIRRQILRGIPELLAKAGVERSSILGIGIGFGGPVDDATHTVIKSHQIEGWNDFRLAAWLSEITGFPAVLGNDSDVAGLAEALFGAGAGISPIFYMNIGSGIGGALIIDGEIYRGGGRGAAEVGHLLMEDSSCFNREDILENFASGWAIARYANSEARAGKDGDSLLRLAKGEGRSITADQVGEAAAQGDAFALSCLDVAWQKIAAALCHVIVLLCPRRIVIGGGVSLIGEELLFVPLRKLVSERVFKPFAQSYEIVPAALAQEVVVHGALAYARQRLSA